MRIVKAWWLLGCAFALVGVAYGYQAPFREYPSVEYGRRTAPSRWSGENRICLCAADVSARAGMTAIAGALTETGVSGFRSGRRIIRRPTALSRRPFAA